ncbi:Tetratricopeptide-like helical domain superfamily [Sesbania bispinosa]|nr:Tetratricopeptide-like helical domain superfamily [Sesbania bispinosa]
MPERNVITWNSMLSTYIQHGFSEEGLKLYVLMRSKGVKPDWITFATTIRACADLAIIKLGIQVVSHAINHMGLVAEGKRYFDSLTDVLAFLQQMSTLLVMVDLLEEQGACRIHHDLALAENCCEDVDGIDVEDSGGCSWIEVDNRVHVFTVDDTSHPQIKGIYIKTGGRLMRTLEDNRKI